MKLKPIALTWAVALMVPFAICLSAQIPLCTISVLSEYFRSLKAYSGILILSAVFVLPAYGIFFIWLKTRKLRLINIGIFTVVLPFYFPILWIFGFYTSRLFFSECL